MSDDLSNELPWNEEQWERFLLESDIRSAKFGELLETLHDDPNCDEIIAHEMGWDRDDDDDGEQEEEGFEAPEFNLPNLDDTLVDGEWEEMHRERKQALKAIPAYSRGYAWGLKVHKALQPYLRESDDEPEPDDPLVEAFSNSLIVAAKIAGGHGMGYEDEVLCGNIVCCKRSLEAAERSITALQELQRQGTVPADTIVPLLAEAREIRTLVAEHIAELRSRVWWADAS